jgi:hypothetical protein
VEWNPANESTAIQALIETSDTGVSAENEAPTEGKIKLSRDVAKSVSKRYKALTLKKLVVSSEDGEVESGGVSSETIITELVNGDDERHTGSYTATVLIDNSTKEVDIVDGVGELQITTDKNVNAVVNVRAIELNGSKAVSSDEIGVDVI